MAGEPPLTVDEWIEIHKLSPVVLRMVLRAGPLLTAVAIGATGSDPHLLALQDQPSGNHMTVRVYDSGQAVCLGGL